LAKRGFVLRNGGWKRSPFYSIVEKAWGTPCTLTNCMDRWQFRVRTLRRMIRGWAANEVAAQNRAKVELSKEFTGLESVAEIRELSSVERQELAQIEDKLEQN